MKGQHVDPEEAVKIHQDLQAKRSVAIHWGTFALAYEVRLKPSPLPTTVVVLILTIPSFYLPSPPPAVLPGAPGPSQRGPGSDRTDV